MRFLVCVVISVVCLLHFSIHAPTAYGDRKLIWTESLDMLELPDFKGLKLKESAEPDVIPSVYKGILTLDTTSQDCFWYYWKEVKVSLDKGYTVEVRLKVDPATPDKNEDGIAIGLEDGTHDWRVYFQKDRVGFNRAADGPYHSMDTTNDFNTYRITVRRHKIKLYIDKGDKGKVVIEAPLFPKKTKEHRIYFGDITQRKGSKGRAYWDYVRFYLNGAVSEDILYTADYLRYIKGRE